MAFSAYMIIDGTNQGRFKGEDPKPREVGSIPILSLGWAILSLGGSVAQGKQSDVNISKVRGDASVQLYQAFVTGESLEVRIRMLRGDGSSAHVVQTIVLHGAVISHIQYPSTRDSDTAMEHIGFSPSKVESIGVAGAAEGASAGG